MSLKEERSSTNTGTATAPAPQSFDDGSVPVPGRDTATGGRENSWYVGSKSLERQDSRKQDAQFYNRDMMILSVHDPDQSKGLESTGDLKFSHSQSMSQSQAQDSASHVQSTSYRDTVQAEQGTQQPRGS